MQSSPIAHQRVLNYAYVDTDTLYQDFQIPQQGYNEKQVEESRIAYGRNVLSGRASDTVLYRLRRAFVNPFTVILFVLAAVSFLTDVVLASNFSRNITTSVIILCMLLLSGIVRFIQELRAKRIADHLTRMVSSTCFLEGSPGPARPRITVTHRSMPAFFSRAAAWSICSEVTPLLTFFSSSSQPLSTPR